MSQADMALVRDAVPGGYNLAVGEPFFLQEVYGTFYPRWFEGKLTYPLLNGDPELVEMLRKRFGGQHVVVTNGAKQALLASIYALQMKRERDPDKKVSFQQVYHEAPFWPTYPTLADLSGLGFTEKAGAIKQRRTLNIVTAPNNPDGRLADRIDNRWDIWDAAYASRVYGWDYLVPYHRISVWSAAKLYGPSGYRIGWLATADKKLADLASQYVEKTTSGVATPSQVFLKNLMLNLGSVSVDEEQRLIAKARDLLLKTNEAFMELHKHFRTLKGFPEHRTGMFAWVQANDPQRFRELLDRAKVKAVNGVYCGGEPDWFRFSLGVLPETMQEAVKAIREVERGG